MKRNLLLSLLACLIALTSVFALVACGESGEDTNTDFTLSATQIEMSVGEEKNLTLNYSVEGTVEVKAEDEEIVSVRLDGKLLMLNALKEGETNVTATLGELKASCKVVVTAAETVTISNDGTNLTEGQTVDVLAGETVTLTATASKGSAIKWSSSNQAVASVENGVITANKPGQAVVTAYVDETCKATVTVNVTLPESEVPEVTLELIEAYNDVWMAFKTTVHYDYDAVTVNGQTPASIGEWLPLGDTGEYRMNMLVGDLTLETYAFVFYKEGVAVAKAEYKASAPQVEKTYELKTFTVEKGENDVPTFVITIEYQGYTTEELSAIPWYIDFQQNHTAMGSGDSGTTFMTTAKPVIAFGEGTMTLSYDISSLAPYKYTMHFSDKGEAGELKPEQSFETPVLTIGAVNYKVVCYAGEYNDGTKYWGCVGLEIWDGKEHTLNDFNENSIIVEDGKVYLVITGAVKGYAPEDITADLQQFEQNDNVAAQGGIVTIADGVMTVKLEITSIPADPDAYYLGHVTFAGDSGATDFIMPATDKDVLATCEHEGKVYSVVIHTAWEQPRRMLRVTEAGMVEKTFTPVNVEIKEIGGKATYVLTVEYEGYTTEELSAINWYFDLQGNPYAVSGSWSGDRTRYLKDDKPVIAFGEGTMTLSYDVSTLAVFKYTSHFAKVAPVGDSGADLKVSATFNRSYEIGGRRYTLVSDHSNESDGAKFWGNVGLIVEEIKTEEEVNLPVVPVGEN